MLEDTDSEIKCTDTFYLRNVMVHFRSSLPERSFSSGTKTVVGSLLSMALYFSWRYILVSSIFWVCRWIIVSGKSKFVGSSVLSVISWLLLCVPLDLPPLNTTTSSCLQIQALKQYQSSDTTCESSLQQVMSPTLLWFVLAAAVNLSSHNSTTREYYLLRFFHHLRLTAEVWSERRHSLLKSALFN